MKKILILLLVCLTIITGCGSKNNNKVASNGFVIVDVRTKEEYDESHIKGAINIPYDQIDSNTNLDKNKTIKVYCKSGKRSNIAYNTLKSLGYRVIDLGAYDSINMEKE
jgi:phage shock protein E